MPNQPKTKNRVMRIPDDEWDAVKEAAAANGETVVSIVRAALREYVADHQARATPRRRRGVNGARK